jgi:hypothetical protein
MVVGQMRRIFFQKIAYENAPKIAQFVLKKLCTVDFCGATDHKANYKASRFDKQYCKSKYSFFNCHVISVKCTHSSLLV